MILAALLLAATTFERPVAPGGAGPNRLDVDAALLARAQPGLTDLRLVDASGNEVPYLLIEPPARDPEYVPATTLPIAQTKTTSGFEADLGTPRRVDRIRLAELAPPFLKHARVEGSGDRARWTLLADATVFDLPEQKLRHVEIAFPASELRYIRVTWNDRSSARVGTPRVWARLHGTGAPPEPLRVSVPFRKRASEPGKSRYRLTLPGRRMPLTAIELQVENGNVFREASVSEPRLQGAQVLPVVLGGDVLKRAERNDGVAADMEIPISAPEGRDLDVAVDDGNNPPLTITAAIAHLAPQPWIYFESRDGAPLTARFGDARANAPRYDLEASRKFATTAKTAQAAWRGGEQRSATGPAPDTTVPPFGATVDRAKFDVARPIAKSERGLTVLLLDADVLARSRALQDVRIVDAEQRQVPYLVEQREEPLIVELPLPKREERDGRSLYRIALPYDRFPEGTSIAFTTSARVFSRDVVLQSAQDERMGRMASAMTTLTWRSDDPENLPPSLTYASPFAGVRQLELLLDEGDNAPLPITSARLYLPSSALRLYHPGTELTLFYGADDVAAPRYDLALLAPRLFGESAHELTLAPIGRVPTPDEGDAKERTFFWIAIGVAALVLLVLLGRLLAPVQREEAGPLGETPGGGDAPR